MSYETSVAINGTLVENDIFQIDVRRSISENNSVSSAVLMVENVNGRNKNTFSIGDDIVIEINQKPNSEYPLVFPFSFSTPTTVFGGVVTDIIYTGRGSNREEIQIQCKDYTVLLQDSLIQPIVYKNTEISSIVTDIITNNVPGVTTTNVNATGVTKQSKRYNHNDVFDAIKELANEIGYFFYVDENKDLHFKQKGSVSSDIRFDQTNIMQSKFKRVDRELVNNIWVYGSRRLTGWEESFSADGGSVFTLQYNPRNTNVFVGGSTTPKQGGVFELLQGNVGSPIQYLVDFDQSSIIFVSGTATGDNIPVSGTDTVQIKYERDTPIVKFGIDRISQSTYGKKESIEIDKNITDPRDATDRVNTILLEKSSPIIEGTLKINGLVDITPGQTVTVNLPSQNVNEANYDVIEVSYNITRKNEMACNLTTVKLNKRIININDTIKQLKLDLKKVQADDITQADTFTRLESAIGEFTLQREWFIKTRNIGNSFVLGHPVNGIIGSPQVGINGSQLTIGSASASAFTIVKSGGTF